MGDLGQVDAEAVWMGWGEEMRDSHHLMAPARGTVSEGQLRTTCTPSAVQSPSLHVHCVCVCVCVWGGGGGELW